MSSFLDSKSSVLADLIKSCEGQGFAMDKVASLSGGAVNMAPSIADIFDINDFDVVDLVTPFIPVVVVPVILILLFFIAKCAACCCCRANRPLTKGKSQIIYGVLALACLGLVATCVLAVVFSFSAGSDTACSMFSFISTSVYGTDDTADYIKTTSSFIGIEGVVESVDKLDVELADTTALANDLDDILKEYTKVCDGTDPMCVPGVLNRVSTDLTALTAHGEGTKNTEGRFGATLAPKINWMFANMTGDADTLATFRDIVNNDLSNAFNEFESTVRSTLLDSTQLTSIRTQLADTRSSVVEVADSIMDQYRDLELTTYFDYLDKMQLGLAIISLIGLLVLLGAIANIGCLTYVGRKHRKFALDTQAREIDAIGLFALQGTGKGLCRTRIVCCSSLCIVLLLMLFTLLMFPVTFAFGSVCRLLVDPVDGDLTNSLNQFGLTTDGQTADVYNTCVGINGDGDLINAFNLGEDFDNLLNAGSFLGDINGIIASNNPTANLNIAQTTAPFVVASDVVVISAYYGGVGGNVNIDTAPYQLVNLLDTAETLKLGAQSLTFIPLSNVCTGNAINAGYTPDSNLGQTPANQAVFCQAANNIVTDPLFIAAQPTLSASTKVDDLTDTMETFDKILNGVPSNDPDYTTYPGFAVKITNVVQAKIDILVGIAVDLREGLDCRFIGDAIRSFSDAFCNGLVGNLMATTVCWAATLFLCGVINMIFAYAKRVFRVKADGSNIPGKPATDMSGYASAKIENKETTFVPPSQMAMAPQPQMVGAPVIYQQQPQQVMYVPQPYPNQGPTPY